MGPLGSNVIKRVHFIGKKTKSYARSYFKTMRESINPVFHTWVIIKRVVVKVDKFGGVSLEDGALKGSSNVGFYESNALESDEALKMLYKKHDVPIVYVFFYQNYLILPCALLK